MTQVDAPYDGRPELRELIHEYVGLASIHAGLCQTYAELGDDLGLQYALRRFRSYAEAAISIFGDLDDANNKLIGGAQ
jgi:hypothetical protein